MSYWELEEAVFVHVFLFRKGRAVRLGSANTVTQPYRVPVGHELR